MIGFAASLMLDSSVVARAVPDPPSAACLRRFAVVGFPVHRSPVAEADQFHPVICRKGYALSFNTRTRNPDWVMERLNPKVLAGAGSRSNRFRPDPALAALSPKPADFRGSGFDKGHQAPAADAKADQRAMDESFYMSNMSPQVGPGFNRGEWRYLETQVRTWVLCERPDLIVITGPVYGTGNRTIAARPITVPEGYYKIAYDPRRHQAIGFKLLNQRYIRTDLAAFAVPIRQIESETGLDFFSAMSVPRQSRLEATATPVWTSEKACAASVRRRRPVVIPTGIEPVSSP